SLLLERGLRALALHGFGRLDAQPRLTLGVLAGGLDPEDLVALGPDLGLLCLAAFALGLGSGGSPRLLRASNRMLLFLDAVLLGRSELAEREQHGILTLLGLGHGPSFVGQVPDSMDLYHARSRVATSTIVRVAPLRYTLVPRWALSTCTATSCTAWTTAPPTSR